jgi:hypothetical protein
MRPAHPTFKTTGPHWLKILHLEMTLPKNGQVIAMFDIQRIQLSKNFMFGMCNFLVQEKLGRWGR